MSLVSDFFKGKLKEIVVNDKDVDYFYYVKCGFSEANTSKYYSFKRQVRVFLHEPFDSNKRVRRINWLWVFERFPELKPKKKKGDSCEKN